MSEKLFHEILSEEERRKIRNSKLKDRSMKIMNDLNLIYKRNPSKREKISGMMLKLSRSSNKGIERAMKTMKEINDARWKMAKDFKSFQNEGRKMFGKRRRDDEYF